MKKIYLYLMFHVLLIGSLLFNSQGFSEGYPRNYSTFTPITQLKQTKYEGPLLYESSYQTNYITSNVFYSESTDSETILNLFKDSILCLIDNKIYLKPDKLLIYQGRYLLLNDQNQQMFLDGVFKDDLGFCFYVNGPVCPNGHVGFKIVWSTWYCLEEDCPYYYFNNFN
jgi:hypothetical protein